jgi:NADPH:quinone reductase-like Zn-dependent oxidoreductase/SAM-dependent methyltransferase/acyl carrier protein
VTYHVAWENRPTASRAASPAPVALTRLHEVAQQALDEVLDMRGRANLDAASAAGDELTAAQVASGVRAMGAEGSFTAKTLGVAESMRRSFVQLMDNLVKQGLLSREGLGYQTTSAFKEAADSASSLLSESLGKYPGHLPEALICGATCADLGPIMRGEKEAVQVLFTSGGADLLDQFYGDGLVTSPWLAAIGSAVAEAARQLPEGRGLRILEIGAGTGGLASQVLPLIERGLHSYVFSDVSAAFFPAARQKLAAYPEVDFQTFDLEKPGNEQEFDLGSFDIILGTNVIHAVSDVRYALRNINHLLAPGGSLLFVDVATPHLWLNAVFGLTSGWWRFTDRDLRPHHPLLGREQWQKALSETGFSETASLSGLIRSQGGESLIGLMARKPWSEPIATAPDTVEVPMEKSWLVFADSSGLGENLATQLRLSGVRCRVAHRGTTFKSEGSDAFTLRAEAPEDWKQLLQACAEEAPERFVFLWSLDESDPGADMLGTDALFHLTQAIEIISPAAKLHLDVITRGAQAIGRNNDISLAQAPSIGLMRVIANEHNNFTCRSIDLPSLDCGSLLPLFPSQPAGANADRHSIPSPALADAVAAERGHPLVTLEGSRLPTGKRQQAAAVQSAAHLQNSSFTLLWNELLQQDTEREIAFRGEARYVRRITRGLEPREQILDRNVPLRLESRERGLLDALRLVPFALPPCGAGEVVIDVKAAGMNFRDVLKALALYPAETADARIFGDEVAGVVKTVGAGVTHVKAGDRVFGLAVFGLATDSMARAGDVRIIPDGLSFEEAATLPVVFMTSWHALKTVAQLQPGERVLVHAGAGGVGMAAIQIAHHLGAEVIASAGSAAKRSLLTVLGVKHVVDSRRADFAEAVMEITEGKGVDVVLNALAAEAIPMGLSCLAQFGRFIEIGKRDIYQNSRIPLWPLRKNASFHVVAMDAIFSGDEKRTRQILETIAELVERKALQPLPFRSFPACRIDSAFRLMAQGKHTGKVIVSFPEPFVVRRGEPLVPAFEVKPDGTYLITGAFGGFGKVLAEWLADCGAKYLVLTSRNGAATPAAEAFVTKLCARGVNVQVIKADAGSAMDVKRVLAGISAAGHLLKGVFHLAMVIDDAPMASLTRERMMKIIAPKANGAWLLHEGTLGMELDCFVMFSSLASVFGNSAQANYAAANAFLDALAHHRHFLGLPALSINWGALGGEGYVARNERVAEYLALHGTTPLSPGEVVTLVESFLNAGATQALAMRVDWSKWRQSYRGGQESPLLERIYAAGVDAPETSGAKSDWRLKIESASPADRTGVIGQAVRDVVGSVLRVKPEGLRLDQPLTDLGLDSLMAVEIENSIESSIGVTLPPASLMRARTIGQIATLIAEHMGAAKGATPAPAVIVVEPAAAEDVDLDAISDDDLDQLLGSATTERPVHIEAAVLEVRV